MPSLLLRPAGVQLHEQAMTQQAYELPPDGIPIKSLHLFIVDVEHLVDNVAVATRRAFVDLDQAIRFIGKRESRLSAFFSPIGMSTDAAMFGTVKEAFVSNHSASYMLRFANAPTLVVKGAGAGADVEFEPYHRVYPPLGMSA